MHVVRGGLRIKDGVLTLYDTLFQKIYTRATRWQYIFSLQPDISACWVGLQLELFPVHSPLLGESLLVSFPPLINMLKFSGSSYLISDQKVCVIEKESPVLKRTPFRTRWLNTNTSINQASNKNNTFKGLTKYCFLS